MTTLPQQSLPQRSLIGLGLLSAGALVVEIALTRLFSTLYYPPFVFAILSLAVLGIGLGAGLAAWQQTLRRSDLVPGYVALAALATLLVLPAALFLTAPTLRLLVFVLVILPFLCVGLAMAALFSHAGARIPLFYLADLVGAGMGALLVVPILNNMGLIDGLLLAVLAMGLAATLFSRRAVAPLPWLAILLAALALIGSNAGVPWLDADMARLPTDKPITARLQNGGTVLHATWDAFARTDLVDPGGDRPYELYIDGAAGSLMPTIAQEEVLWQDIGLFPFATEQPARVFIVGPGGGLDVWFGLQSRADEIVAVEVNPASVDLVQAFAAANGDLYGHPGVRVLVDEGRSVLQREEARYDLIFLSQVVTLAAERSGYALVENSAYTVEAFQTYLDHLTDNGQIALKLYDEPTLTRALATALTVFSGRGLSDADALRHVIAILDPNVEPPVPLLLVRKSPYSREDALSIGAVAREVGFAPLFLPGVLAQPPLDAIVAGQGSFADVIAASDLDIRPTSDDRPFFFQFERGLPHPLPALLLGIAALLLVGAAVLVAVSAGKDAASQRWFFLYFAALGFGFMMVEIAVIQQTRLFLGHPTLAVTVVLATLLVGGGIGSGLGGRWLGVGVSIWPIGGIVVWMFVWLLLWPPLAETVRAAATPWRLAVVVTGLLPLALCMGMPFPLGLRAVARFGDRHVALAWAINGVMSVFGSVAAVALAIVAGYSWALVAALAAYSLAGGIVRLLKST